MNSDDPAIPSPAPQLRIFNQANDKDRIFAHWYCSLENVANLQCAILFYSDQSLIFALARWNVINNYTSADTVASLRIPLLLLLNIISISWHLFSASPEPLNSELRGFLSGSTVIDVVGEFPPSKLRLLCLDLLCFAIQFLMLVVSHEQKKLAIKTIAPPAETQIQDIDAEEQGIQRSEQTLLQPAAIEVEVDAESAALLGIDMDEDEGVPVLDVNFVNSLRETVG